MKFLMNPTKVFERNNEIVFYFNPSNFYAHILHYNCKLHLQTKELMIRVFDVFANSSSIKLLLMLSEPPISLKSIKCTFAAPKNRSCPKRQPLVQKHIPSACQLALAVFDNQSRLNQKDFRQ